MDKLREEIARVAYELYEKRGKGHGRHHDDWLEAERVVMARHAKGTLQAETPAGSVKRKAAARAPKEKKAAGEGAEAPKKRTSTKRTVTKKKT